MPTSNHNAKNLAVAGVGHRFTNAWFRPMGPIDPPSFGGAFVRSVARTGVGTYLVTLAPFTPVALVSATAYYNRAANPTGSFRVGAVSLSAEAKTATVVVYTQFGANLTDYNGIASQIVELSFHWKMFSGKDWSGL